MQRPSNDSEARVLPSMGLRKAIGWLGTVLPFVLALGGAILFSTGIQSSLSAYYHTDIGDVFVGTLCAIGVFMYAYKGHTGKDGDDDPVGAFAGVCAIGVALFPTDRVDASTSFVGMVHVGFALLFFLTLAYFSLALFRKSHRDGRPRTAKKKERDKVYWVAGYTILTSIALIGILGLIERLSLVPEQIIQCLGRSETGLCAGVGRRDRVRHCMADQSQALLEDPEDQADEANPSPQQTAGSATV